MMHTSPASTIIVVFCFNHPATTEIYTLSLHDALPIYLTRHGIEVEARLESANRAEIDRQEIEEQRALRDRKSTRLNSSHLVISYAVFCLKKKIQYKNDLESPPDLQRQQAKIQMYVEQK